MVQNSQLVAAFVARLGRTKPKREFPHIYIVAVELGLFRAQPLPSLFSSTGDGDDFLAMYNQGPALLRSQFLTANHSWPAQTVGLLEIRAPLVGS